MVKIHINKIQESKLISEAKSEMFSFEILKSIPSFSKRIKYCNQYLGFSVGGGSSRRVFQLDDNKVLKLAINAKGIAQNEQEFNFSKENFVDITPNVFDDLSDTENYTFITSEYVLPARKTDFQKVLNISFEKFVLLIRTVNSWYDYRNRLFNKLSDEEITELEENSDNINEFVNYVSNYQPPIGDMTRCANYGLTMRNGNPYIVLLDSGLSDEIYSKFYAPKINENIKVHKGEMGKRQSTQAKWKDTIDCEHCGCSKAFFSMSISDGNKGRGRIKITDNNGKEMDSEVQTIALYYCPNCYRFTALNNMA